MAHTTDAPPYRTRSQLRRGFSEVNRGLSALDESPGADIIQLNSHTNSTRDNRSAFDGGYQVQPPVSVPYGWRLEGSRSGWSLTHDRHEWSTIGWLVAEHAAGRSYRQLAEQLERDGVPAPTGGRSIGRWNTERVRTLVLHYAPEQATPPRRDPFAARLETLRSRRPEDLSDEELEEMHDLLEDYAP